MLFNILRNEEVVAVMTLTMDADEYRVTESKSPLVNMLAEMLKEGITLRTERESKSVDGTVTLADKDPIHFVPTVDAITIIKQWWAVEGLDVVEVL